MIPDKPLELDIGDMSEMTLGELEVFDEDFVKSRPIAWLREFRNFLVSKSNWSADEVRQIRLNELEQVARQVVAKLEQSIIPPAKGAP